MRHLKLFSVFFVFVCVAGGAEILKPERLEILNLQREAILSASFVQKNSWIGNLGVSYKYSKDASGEPGEVASQRANAFFSQDLFRSGGIYYGISYAKNNENVSLISWQISKNELYARAYTLLADLKMQDLRAQKLRLELDNSQLDINKKREQFLAGLVDVSFLNTAILTKTSQENSLLDLTSAKDGLLTAFLDLSLEDYKTFPLFDVPLPSKDEFLSRNLVLAKERASVAVQDYAHKLTRSSYLPKLSFDAYYTFADKTEPKNGRALSKDPYYGYSFSLSMPLSFTEFSDTQSKKLNATVQKNQAALLEEQEARLYDAAASDVARIDKKIELAKGDMDLYAVLLRQTKEQVRSGLKTPQDLKTMENSIEIRRLDQEIYKIQKFEKLLEIYKKTAVL